jgi:hypothetical protein
MPETQTMDVTLEALVKSREIFSEALKGLRSIVHRVCIATGTSATCPYLKQHDDSLTCETCPLNKEKERQNNGTKNS